MKMLLQTLDPETYGLNRTAVVFGVMVAVVAIVGCSKLLAVLHAAGLPSAH